MKILISLLILGIIIIIHELGHFLSAKFFKVPVSEFSIGMGPEVYTYEGDQTKYSFRSIPIGGYVSIEGMELDDDREDGFNKKNPFIRFVILFAGVFMNFLLAYLIIFGITLNQGKITLNVNPVVGNTMEYSGNVFKKGDKIIKIDGNKVEKWIDIKKIVSEIKDKENTQKILIERDGIDKLLEVKLYKGNDNDYYLGILPEYKIEKLSFTESLKLSGKGFVHITKSIFKGFEMIISGKVSRKEISGPVGIVNIVGEASEQGFLSIVSIMAILSINIGIFNLLPFPALDGGRIIFVILEMFGIKVNKKMEERVHKFGILILFILIIFITTNDFFNLTGK